jgi:isopentenyl diphosphate isomerase/L-lactate dehydrogenase-like FMN-dependent dehydrogenase
MIISSPSDYRNAVRHRLPRFLFDYIDGGANAEHTIRRYVGDLLIKGILDPEDARDALRFGADGIVRLQPSRPPVGQCIFDGPSPS